MATRSEQRESFLAANPLCVFCGGTELATTVEHCPPRSLFQFRQWPEGFEFPACERCNLGTGDEDAAVAMLARMSPDGSTGNDDGRLAGLIRNVNAQFPGLVRKMMPSHLEARRRNREMGIKPRPGQLHQDVAPVNLPEELKAAVGTFARKLALAIFYRETAVIFPATGTLAFNWFTNVELVTHGTYKLFDQLAHIDGSAPLVVRGGKYLTDQFEYKISLSPRASVFLLQARLGQSFGLVIFGSRLPGPIEETVASLQAKYGHQGPIAFLQGGASLP